MIFIYIVDVEKDVEKNKQPNEEATDEALAAQAQSGSKEAYNELVRRYMRRAYSLAYQIVKDMEAARDLSQDVFIKVYQSLDSYDTGRRFFPWFCRILINHCLNYKRRKRIVAWHSLSDEYTQREADRFAAGSDNKHNSSDENEMFTALHNAIDRLPKKQRLVVLLHGIEGLSQKETAETLGISEGTVRSRFFYARDRLRALMEKEKAIR